MEMEYEGTSKDLIEENELSLKIEMLKELKKKESQVLPVLFTETICQCRDVVVEWMREVMQSCDHSMPTICFAIGLFDRIIILDETSIPRGRLQLFACIAILLACKMEEEYVKIPPISVLNECTDNTYKEDILREYEIYFLNKLHWDLRSVITPFDFYAIYRNIIILSTEQSSFHHLSGIPYSQLKDQVLKTSDFLLEVCRQHYQFLSYLPSEVAHAIVFVARKWNQIEPYWPSHIAKLAKLEDEDFLDCVRELEETCQKFQSHPLHNSGESFS